MPSSSTTSWSPSLSSWWSGARSSSSVGLGSSSWREASSWSSSAPSSEAPSWSSLVPSSWSAARTSWWSCPVPMHCPRERPSMSGAAARTDEHRRQPVNLSDAWGQPTVTRFSRTGPWARPPAGVVATRFDRPPLSADYRSGLGRRRFAPCDDPVGAGRWPRRARDGSQP